MNRSELSEKQYKSNATTITVPRCSIDAKNQHGCFRSRRAIILPTNASLHAIRILHFRATIAWTSRRGGARGRKKHGREKKENETKKKNEKEKIKQEGKKETIAPGCYLSPPLSLSPLHLCSSGVILERSERKEYRVGASDKSRVE